MPQAQKILAIQSEAVNQPQEWSHKDAYERADVRLAPKRFAASRSPLGSMMESSYLRQATVPRVVVIEVKRARRPKASGP
jgi:hypothetical protein